MVSLRFFCASASMLFHCCVDYHLIRVGTLLEQTYLTLDCIQRILNFSTQEENEEESS
jgi:hypothetical protein